MVAGLYGSILKELADILKIPTLEPDRNNSCLIKFAGDLEVYIQMDKEERNLIICADVGQIPFGRFRENVFRQALAANGLPYPRYGEFAFSSPANSLVLFSTLPVQDLHGDKVAEELLPLVEKAKLWKESISKGDVPVVQAAATAPSSGMMGMR